MSTKYLLPCTQCEQHVAIATGQAGDTVRCECGADLNVPPMSEIRKLEAQEQTSQAAPTGTWGPKQGALLLGSVIALAAAAAGIHQWSQMPAKPQITPQHALQSELQRIDSMSPSHSWSFWHYDILELGLSPLHSTLEVQYQAQVRSIQPRMIFFFVVAGLGVVLAISSLAWPGPQT